LFNIKCYR